jgi:predicted Zn-dependent protease
LERIDADLKRIDEVLKEVLRAPDDPSLRSEAGIIFLRNGEAQKGLRWLGMALQQDPWHPPTHQALADYYQDTGRLELAARHRQLAQPGAKRRLTCLFVPGSAAASGGPHWGD